MQIAFIWIISSQKPPEPPGTIARPARGRNAIYGYLTAVYDLVAHTENDGDCRRCSLGGAGSQIVADGRDK